MKIMLMAALLTLTSCATKVKGLKKSDSFTAASIQSGAIGVGGVVNSMESWKYKEKVSYANLLRQELLDEREGMNVKSIGIVAKKLGRKDMEKVMSEFEDNSSLSVETIQMINKKLKNMRYITLARVENDQIEKKQEQRMESEKSASGGGMYIDSKVTRTVTVNFSVYDLTNGENVWNGTISKKKENMQSYREESTDGAAGLINLVEAIQGKDQMNQAQKYPFPKATSMRDLLEESFEGFAENLPEED